MPSYTNSLICFDLETFFHHLNVVVVEILSCSSHFCKFLAVRRFNSDHLIRYHHGIYHLEHKREFTGFKLFFGKIQMIGMKIFPLARVQYGIC